MFSRSEDAYKLDETSKQVGDTTRTIEELKNMKIDISALNDHKYQCMQLHEQHITHRKRHDDAMNNLSESSMMLAKSIADINATINKFIEEGSPVIKFWSRAGTYWAVQKSLASTVVGLALGFLAIAGAYKLFFEVL